MMIEPEFLIIAGLVFIFTATVWVRQHGLKALVADRAPLSQAVFTQWLRQSEPSARPHLLAVTSTGQAPSMRPCLTSDVASSPSDERDDTSMSRGQQLGFLSHIVASAVASADRAERLQCAAGEQVDGAHYALQNLLDELSTVMSITAPSKGRRDNRQTARPQSQRLPIAMAA